MLLRFVAVFYTGFLFEAVTVLGIVFGFAPLVWHDATKPIQFMLLQSSVTLSLSVVIFQYNYSFSYFGS